MEVNIEKLGEATFFICEKYASRSSGAYVHYQTLRTRPHWSKLDRNKVSIMYKIVDCGNVIRELLKIKSKVYVSDLVDIINTKLNLYIKAGGIIFLGDSDIDQYNVGIVYINNELIGSSSNGIRNRFEQCYFVLRDDMTPLTMTKTEQKEHDEAKEKATALKNKETFIREFLSPFIEQITTKYCASYNAHLCAIKLFSDVKETIPTNQMCINSLIRNSIGKELEAIGITIPENYCFFDRYDHFVGYINLLQCNVNLE